MCLKITALIATTLQINKYPVTETEQWQKLQELFTRFYPALVPIVLFSHRTMFFFSVLFPPDVHSTGHGHRSRSQYFTDSFLPHSHSTVQSRSYNPLTAPSTLANATHNTVTRLDTLLSPAVHSLYTSLTALLGCSTLFQWVFCQKRQSVSSYGRDSHTGKL